MPKYLFIHIFILDVNSYYRQIYHSALGTIKKAIQERFDKKNTKNTMNYEKLIIINTIVILNELAAITKEPVKIIYPEYIIYNNMVLKSQLQ